MIGRIVAVSGVAALLMAAASWCTRSPGLLAAQDKKPDLTQAKYYGAITCYKCHAQAIDDKAGKWPTDLVRMDEFTIWQNEGQTRPRLRGSGSSTRPPNPAGSR